MTVAGVALKMRQIGVALELEKELMQFQVKNLVLQEWKNL